jgi:flagellar biosynthetic protein FlhB
VSEEKTEKPTPKKIKESRKEGQVPRTQEFGGWGSLLVVAVSMKWLVAHGVESVQELLVQSTALAGNATEADAIRMIGEAGKLMLVMSVALGSLIMLIGAIAAASQGGIHLATKLPKPKLNRLDPIKGAKRVFGPHALWEGAKTLIKSSLVAFFVWRGVQGMMPLLGGLVPVHTALELAAAQALGLMRDVALAGLVAAAADYMVQRHKTGKQIKMTKKEVKDEHKQSEGDPLIKQALRSRQLAAARNRMMADVPKADVVLVNPVHVAVALKYDAEKGAPRIVAKGAGAVASRIRALATDSRVPLVEDVPLARALHASCEVGQEIPIQLYEAVAQVLAFVLSRRNQGTTAARYRSPRDPAPLPEVPSVRRRAPRALATAGSSPADSSPADSSPGATRR